MVFPWFFPMVFPQETRLKAERDDKVRLRGQAGIHKRNGEAGQVEVWWKRRICVGFSKSNSIVEMEVIFLKNS